MRVAKVARDPMKTLIIYDSAYGNTEQVANAIGAAIGVDSSVVRASGADPAASGSIDLLIVGAPTYGGRPMPPVKDFLDKLPESVVKGIKVAAFDTRLSGRFARIFGFAADRIAEELKAKGGVLALPPEGFVVEGKKGPLRQGELERAAAWAKDLVKPG